MDLNPSNSNSKSTGYTNSSHIHNSHLSGHKAGLSREIQEELFRAIAKKEARRILKDASLSEISKYLDPK